MKTQIHKSNSRGKADHGWLKANHTFSFASYMNPERMNFGVLRVINDDEIAPKMGFGTHPHNNMEIITVPIKGALRHKDSMGNEYVIRAGEVQVMSAGTGITHSEYSDMENEITNLLQIWVMPKKQNIKPRYDQKDYSGEPIKNHLKLVVSPDGREDSHEINQDAYFSLGEFDQDQELLYKLNNNKNGVYAFLIEGTSSINGQELSKRDGVGIEDIDQLDIKVTKGSKILIMEVPMA